MTISQHQSSFKVFDATCTAQWCCLTAYTVMKGRKTNWNKFAVCYNTVHMYKINCNRTTIQSNSKGIILFKKLISIINYMNLYFMQTYCQKEKIFQKFFFFYGGYTTETVLCTMFAKYNNHSKWFFYSSVKKYMQSSLNIYCKITKQQRTKQIKPIFSNFNFASQYKLKFKL